MMRNPTAEEKRLRAIFEPWERFDGEKFYIPEEAPENVKKAREEYQRKCVEPSIRARKAGALFY